MFINNGPQGKLTTAADIIIHFDVGKKKSINESSVIEYTWKTVDRHETILEEWNKNGKILLNKKLVKELK